MREWVVPQLTAFHPAVEWTLPVGILTAHCSMFLYGLLDVVLLAAVRADKHFFSCRGIWPMLSLLMLAMTLLGRVFPVTLGALVLSAAHTSLLMVPQHTLCHEELVTVPTGKLLPSVHIHVFPEVVWCLERQVTYGTLCVLPTNGRNLIRNICHIPSICPTCWQLFPSYQCNHLPFHCKKGRLLDHNLAWCRTLRSISRSTHAGSCCCGCSCS